MDITVINLASQTARWAAMQREFEAVGLQALRHEATAGNGPAAGDAAPAHRYCEDLNRRYYHRPLSAGERGCYASHIAVWQRLLGSERQAVAVFEDDVEIAPRLPQVLGAISTLAGGWDLVKLIGRPQEKIEARTALLPGVELVAYRRVPSLTGAYVLSRSGAEKLLAARRRYGRPVDVDIRHWWECDLQVLGVQPYPVRAAASSEHSCIDGRAVQPSPAMRLHKLQLQLSYTLRNAHALRRRRLQAAPPVPGIEAIEPAAGRP